MRIKYWVSLLCLLWGLIPVHGKGLISELSPRATGCRHEVRISVSDGLTLSTSNFLGMGLADVLTGTRRSVQSSTGLISCGYRYVAASRLKIGMDVGYISISSKIKDRNDKTREIKERVTDVLLLPAVEFLYYKKGLMELYGSTAAGIDIVKYKYSDSLQKEKLPVTFAYQVNPIAVRIGNDRIAGFLEAGMGYKGFLTVGISVML